MWSDRRARRPARGCAWPVRHASSPLPHRCCRPGSIRTAAGRPQRLSNRLRPTRWAARTTNRSMRRCRASAAASGDTAGPIPGCTGRRRQPAPSGPRRWRATRRFGFRARCDHASHRPSRPRRPVPTRPRPATAWLQCEGPTGRCCCVRPAPSFSSRKRVRARFVLGFAVRRATRPSAAPPQSPPRGACARAE